MKNTKVGGASEQKSLDFILPLRKAFTKPSMLGEIKNRIISVHWCLSYIFFYVFIQITYIFFTTNKRVYKAVQEKLKHQLLLVQCCFSQIMSIHSYQFFFKTDKRIYKNPTNTLKMFWKLLLKTTDDPTITFWFFCRRFFCRTLQIIRRSQFGFFAKRYR